MSWIKRNLFFTIGSVVALALMGLAGWFLYTKWNLNNQIFGSLNTYYEDLKGLKAKNPHPGDAKVNNIQIAKQQQVQLSNYVASTRVYFEPIPRIPSAEDAPKITDHDFTTALSRTIDQLQKGAAAASVNLIITNYNFSFEAQRRQVSFVAAGLLPLSTQLGEVKAICDILFAAKINSLENIRRERVSAEDSQGLQTDYLTERKTTNDLAILTPYEVTFKCFSTELSTVLAGFASSPYGMIIKTINVEGDRGLPAPAPASAQPLQSLRDRQSLRIGQSVRRESLRWGRGNGCSDGRSLWRWGIWRRPLQSPGYAGAAAARLRPPATGRPGCSQKHRPSNCPG